MYYEVDNNMSRHVLEMEGYSWGDDAEEDSWVLLNRIDGFDEGEKGEEGEMGEIVELDNDDDGAEAGVTADEIEAVED